MKLGVYVGSFDPVHKGHIKIANYLLNNGYLDKVMIITTGNYWDKQDMESINDRINMLKFYENEQIIVNDNLNHLPYTYQILNELKNNFENIDLYLIIGDDNLLKFSLWKNVDEILKNKVLVIPRDLDNCQNIIEKIPLKENFIIIKDFPLINISSTVIRGLLQEEKYNKVLNYLDNNVLRYIIMNNLYSAKNNPKKRVKMISKDTNG